jgi:hypothetical protein
VFKGKFEFNVNLMDVLTIISLILSVIALLK